MVLDVELALDFAPLPVEERSALAVALLDSLETAHEATVSELWRNG
jgi:hypothetical protein